MEFALWGWAHGMQRSVNSMRDCLLIFGKACHGLVQRGLVFDVVAALRAVDLAQQSGEDRAGSGFDEAGGALGDESPHGSLPLHRAGNLTDQAIARTCSVTHLRGID